MKAEPCRFSYRSLVTLLRRLHGFADDFVPGQPQPFCLCCHMILQPIHGGNLRFHHLASSTASICAQHAANLAPARCVVMADPNTTRAFGVDSTETKRTGQKDKHFQHKPSEHVEHEHLEREANLGQKEARLEKEKESELSNMGERSRRAQPRPSRARAVSTFL